MADFHERLMNSSTTLSIHIAKEGGKLKVLDMFIFSVYSNGNGQARKIVRFLDGFDGDRRLLYQTGFLTNEGQWYSSGATFECSKKTFARWAKTKLKAGYMCNHGEDSSICKKCDVA